jgi:hypothetical protein
MDRRSLLQLVSIGAMVPNALQAGHCAATPVPKPYQLRFFSVEEHRRLEELMELIIPADDHSPGAREARTADFADWMLFHSSPQLQNEWHSGLRLLNPDNLPVAAANEGDPKTAVEVFFVRLKNMTVDGYYTSETGIHRDLGYEGNEYLLKFEGCAHPEHGS